MGDGIFVTFRININLDAIEFLNGKFRVFT